MIFIGRKPVSERTKFLSLARRGKTKRKPKVTDCLLAGKLAGYDFHRAKARERKNEVQPVQLIMSNDYYEAGYQITRTIKILYAVAVNHDAISDSDEYLDFLDR